MTSSNELQPGQYLGLFKFFRERSHLDQFLDGCLYCNTPEYYRLSSVRGAGDPNESCLISFRSSRSDSPLDLEIDGEHAGQASDLITRIGRKDGWLHCWASLTVPENEVAFEKLRSDFCRMQEESGPYYAYITPENSHKFVDRLRGLDLPIEAKAVTYYRGGYYGSSVFHKSEEHSYQREFRILIDECEVSETRNRRFYILGGLRDIVQDCPTIELSARAGNDVITLCISYKKKFT